MVDYPTIIIEDFLAVGFAGGPVWQTSDVRAISGFSQRNQQRARAVHEYQYGAAETAIANLIAIKAFHTEVRGRVFTWLLKDWTDYIYAGESLGIGDGADTTFQVIRTYGAVNPYVRDITDIKSGTLAVYVNAVEKFDPADYTISATGLITVGVAPPSSEAVTADYEFYVPVSFQQDECFIEISARDASFGNISTLDAIEELPSV